MTGLLAVALTLGVLKSVNVTISQIAISRPDGWLRNQLKGWVRDDEPSPSEWSPIFILARRTRRWSRGVRGGRSLDTVVMVLFDILYRTPTFVTIQAALIFAALGTVRVTGAPSKICSLLHALPALDSWLAMTSAWTAVILATFMVVQFLVSGARGTSGPRRMTDQLRRPSAPPTSDDGPQLLATMTILPLVAESLIVSFASLYIALAAVEPNAFQALPCYLNVFSTVYFSTTVAATVGFGDILPIGDFARVIAVLQMFFVVTFLATYVAELFRDRPARLPG
ncbi:MAG TPA: potassium channel family protein [Solirubrobacteraceae bacterium]|nr:potassium channel family protein [Solirubrobacteraceae bacterium]